MSIIKYEDIVCGYERKRTTQSFMSWNVCILGNDLRDISTLKDQPKSRFEADNSDRPRISEDLLI